jgi:hypothetical protein
MKKRFFLIILSGFCIFIAFLLLYFLIKGPGTIVEKGIPPGNDDPVNKRWYRGNTHTHSKFLDYFENDNVPVIASWYESAGYDFLLISDHNNSKRDKRVICHEEAAAPPGYIMLCGLELSRTRQHTALGIDRYIGDEESLQDGVNKTVAAGGVPILNHPGYPVISASEFIATEGLNHFEVFSGKRPKDTPASEMLWDSILSAPGGRIIYAVASDDNHHRKRKAGRGWIMVEAPSLSKDEIKDNIRKGNFYASTGIVLTDYRASQTDIMIDTENGTRITFIGYKGRVLSSIKANGTTYKINGDEQYVRIKITGDDGEMAWTQPFLIK